MTSVFPPGLSFFPVPSALVTFRSPTGDLQLRTTAWLGMVCADPPVLSLALKAGEEAPVGLGWEEEFVVNLPPEEFLTAADFLAALAGRGGDRAVAPWLTLAEATIVGAPVIVECPVRIECVRGTVRTRYGQRILSGSVVAAHMGNVGFGKKRLPLDLHRLRPFAHTWRTCLRSGANRSETPVA